MLRTIITVLIALVLGVGGGILGHSLLKDKDADSARETSAGDDLHIVEVIDGDTIRLESGQRVRLLGIDAPEKGECYYEESRDALAGVIGENRVRLDKDISDMDEYARLLRYVVIPVADPGEDNVFVNEYLVREGYAEASSRRPNKRYESFLRSAEEEAREAARGLWSVCEVEAAQTDALREVDTGPPSPECIVKGNISEKGYGRTYLVPGCDNYNRVKIDVRKGEGYFCSEEEAITAGFRKATNCP